MYRVSGFRLPRIRCFEIQMITKTMVVLPLVVIFLAHIKPGSSHVRSREACLSQVTSGPCRQQLSRWYYSASHQTCLPFTYGGCLGNANNFGSEFACQFWCKPTNQRNPSTYPSPNDNPTNIYGPKLGVDQYNQNLQSGSLLDLNINVLPRQNEYCNQRPDSGPCRQDEIRWYYDKRTGTCSKFLYGGCEGNGNNFKTKEECISACWKDS